MKSKSIAFILYTFVKINYNLIKKEHTSNFLFYLIRRSSLIALINYNSAHMKNIWSTFTSKSKK